MSKFGLYAVDKSRKVTCFPQLIPETSTNLYPYWDASDYIFYPGDTTVSKVKRFGYPDIPKYKRLLLEDKQVNKTELLINGYTVASVFSRTGEEVVNALGIPENNTPVNKFGIYVCENTLYINGRAVAKTSDTSVNPELNITSDGILKFGQCYIGSSASDDNNITRVKCINVTPTIYADLLAGKLVDGYKKYNRRDVYNIVQNIATANVVYYDKKPEDEELLYNNQIDNNGLSYNEVNVPNTFHITDVPFVGIRYFKPRTSVGGTIEMPVYIDSYNCPFTHNPTVESVSAKFTVIVKDSFENILLKRTVYPGVTKLIFGPFVDAYGSTTNLEGETWFSLQVIDERGVESPIRYFDVLVKDTPENNFYQMTMEDLETYHISVNNPDRKAGYVNKKQFEKLFHDKVSAGYNGVKIYNGDDPDDPLSVLPEKYITYNNNIYPIVDGHVTVNDIQYKARTDGYVIIDNVNYPITPRCTYFYDAHSIYSGTQYDASEHNVDDIELPGTEFYIVNIVSENGQKNAYLQKLVPNRDVVVNGVTINVGADPIEFILKDKAELCRSTQDYDQYEENGVTKYKRVVCWSTDLKFEDENTAVFSGMSDASDRHPDYGYRLRTRDMRTLIPNGSSLVADPNIENNYICSPCNNVSSGYRYYVRNTNHYISAYGYEGGQDLVFPDNFTLDLNGTTWRLTESDDIDKNGFLFRLTNNIDTHIINGYIIGAYYNLDWRVAALRLAFDPSVKDNTPMEEVRCVDFESCRYCSLENVELSYSTSYDLMATNQFKMEVPSENKRSTTLRKYGNARESYDPNADLDDYTNKPAIRFNTLGYIDYEGEVHTSVEDHIVEELPEDSSDRKQYNGEAGAFALNSDADALRYVSGKTIYLEEDGSSHISLIYTAAKIDFLMTSFNHPHNGVNEKPDIYLGANGNTSHNNVGKKHCVFVSFYDENDTHIKTIKTRYCYDFKVPDGTRYVRLCGYGISAYNQLDDSYTPVPSGNYYNGYIINRDIDPFNVEGHQYTSDLGFGNTKSLEGLWLDGKKYTKNIEVKNCFVHDTRSCLFGTHGYLGVLVENCKFERIAVEPQIKGSNMYVTSCFLSIEESRQTSDRLHFRNCAINYGHETPFNCTHYRFSKFIGQRKFRSDGCFNLTIEGCNNLQILGIGTSEYMLIKDSIAPGYEASTGIYMYPYRFTQVVGCVFPEPLDVYRNYSTTFGLWSGQRSNRCDDIPHNINTFRDCVFYKLRNSKQNLFTEKRSVVRLINSVVLSKPILTDQRYSAGDNYQETEFRRTITLAEPGVYNYLKTVTQKVNNVDTGAAHIVEQEIY